MTNFFSQQLSYLSGINAAPGKTCASHPAQRCSSPNFKLYMTLMQPSFNIANLTNSVVIIHCHHWTCETTLKYCWQEFEHIYLLKSVMGKLNIKLISLWNGRKRLTQASQEHTDCAHINHKLLLPKLRTQAGCRNSILSVGTKLAKLGLVRYKRISQERSGTM